MEKKFHYNLAGRDLTVTVGKFAEQASGTCMLQYGDTVTMVTATQSKKPREGIDFFPLSCDYEEKLYAVGKIPGGFIKREGRASEKAILTARLIDRPIRPLFPNGFRNDVQVIATVLSVDQDNSPEIASMIGSSIALSISDIPFSGPIGAVNVGLIDGKFIVNPNSEERETSQLDLTVAGTKDAIMMVEAGANVVAEETILEAIFFAHDEIKRICDFIEGITKEVGKDKLEFEVFVPDKELEEKIIEYGTESLIEAINTVEKQEREEKIDEVSNKIFEHFIEEYPDNEADIKEVIDSIIKKEVRRLILEGIRPDNRKPDEIRPISCEVGI